MGLSRHKKHRRKMRQRQGDVHAMIQAINIYERGSTSPVIARVARTARGRKYTKFIVIKTGKRSVQREVEARVQQIQEAQG